MPLKYGYKEGRMLREGEAFWVRRLLLNPKESMGKGKMGVRQEGR